MRVTKVRRQLTGVEALYASDVLLQRLIQGVDRKILLIVDGHAAHKAKLVRRFVEAHSDSIELFYLPPHGPELDPDELAWAHVKSKVGKAVTETGETMCTAQIGPITPGKALNP